VDFLPDTNVLSELRRRTPDKNVLAWFATTRASQLHLSVLVVGEIRQGIARLARRDPARSSRLDEWLTRLLGSYADRILPITADIAQEWGRLNVPDPVAPVDGLLAATAKVHGMTLVTRNTVDVARTGVSLINPFDARIDPPG
jgi:predicted nucleic acid-binding protein